MSIDPKVAQRQAAYWASPDRDQVVADLAQAQAEKHEAFKAAARRFALARVQRRRQEREIAKIRGLVKARHRTPRSKR